MSSKRPPGVSRTRPRWGILLVLALLPAAADAAGIAVAPSNGTEATGPGVPPWVTWAQPAPVGVQFTASSRALDVAWAERRALDNDAARAHVDALVASLRPTLDTGQRDLLQRALFLRGVLEVDDAGGFDALPDGAEVDGQRIPRAWVEAVTLSPGASAPATLDADFAAGIYDEIRTRLVARGGATIDLATPADGEVRVDGMPVRAAITLLPGSHTLSWHPAGADPVALVLDVGPAGIVGHPSADEPAHRSVEEPAHRSVEEPAHRSVEEPAHRSVEEIASLLGSLEQVRTGRADLTPATAAELHHALAAPAVTIEGDGPARLVWLVSGPARWGAPAFGVGVDSGAWLFAGSYAATPDRCGLSPDVDAPTKALVPIGLEGTVALGPWRSRIGAGVTEVVGADDAFATAGGAACPNGVPDTTAMVHTVPWGWVSLGRRIELGHGRELEPFVRAGTLTVVGVAQVGVGLGVVRAGPVRVDVRAQGGVAFNTWSGAGDRAGFLGGVETALVWRGK